MHTFILRYDELIEGLGYAPGRVLSVTWSKPDGHCGTTAPGQEIRVTDGTIINVADTSSA